jgi:hypothetical protein
MIETRPQNAVAGGVDPGNLEACRISATAVSCLRQGYGGRVARGYNPVAASRSPRSHQLAFAND